MNPYPKRMEKTVSTEKECTCPACIRLACEPRILIPSGWEIKSLEHATELAATLTSESGINFIAIDEGSHTSPRYQIRRRPMIGDPVSFGFNGDCYLDGAITQISKSLKVITTSTGKKFYRRRQSGTWKHAGTWFLVTGHFEAQNPHF